MNYWFTQEEEIHRIIRFIGWGGLNTAISFTVYCVFIYFGSGIYIASFFGLVTGILFGHFVNKHSVFRSSKFGTLPRYIIVWAGLYLVNITILNYLSSVGIDPYLSGAIAAVLIVPVSFLMQKFLVFRS